MMESKASGCHSRENGNPEPENQYPWIPACAGMKNPKKTYLTFINLQMCRKCQQNSPFSAKMSLIWRAMKVF
jgi:hypothetical protein